jgi:hypothetical protein
VAYVCRLKTPTIITKITVLLQIKFSIKQNDTLTTIHQGHLTSCVENPTLLQKSLKVSASRFLGV